MFPNLPLLFVLAALAATPTELQPSTWACMHNGQVRRCNPDGTFAEHDAKAWDKNAPSEADMRDDPTLVIRYWKVRKAGQMRSASPGAVNATAAQEYQRRAEQAARAAAADALAAQKAEGQ